MPTREMNGYGLWLVDVSRGTRTRIASEGDLVAEMDSGWPPRGVPLASARRDVGGLGFHRLRVAAGATRGRRCARVAGPAVVVPGRQGARGGGPPTPWRPRHRNPVAGQAWRRPSTAPGPEANEVNAAFSPDGKWLAYQSNETGRDEVYVLAYPPAGRNTLVSPAGGRNPAWNPNGRELFYVSEPDRDGKRWFMRFLLSRRSRARASDVLAPWLRRHSARPPRGTRTTSSERRPVPCAPAVARPAARARHRDQPRDELARGTQGEGARAVGPRRYQVERAILTGTMLGPYEVTSFASSTRAPMRGSHQRSVHELSAVRR